MSPGHVPRAGSAGAAPGPVASSQLFRRPTLLWGADNLAARARATTPWLWHGYLALGALTLLFGRCHAGKTMLASVLLARLKKSGEFAGLRPNGQLLVRQTVNAIPVATKQARTAEHLGCGGERLTPAVLGRGRRSVP